MFPNFLQKAADQFSDQKLDQPKLVPGLVGMPMGGSQQIYVTSRPGYIWVRLYGDTGRFVQAFNTGIVPVYDLPVLVARSAVDRNSYAVIGRNTLDLYPLGLPVWFIDNATNSAYDGDVVTVGTHTIAINTFNSNIPSFAKAISVRLASSWAAASSSNYCLLYSGSGNAQVMVRSYVANYSIETSGICTLSAEGNLGIIVGGANTTGTWIYVNGYWI